MKGITYGLTAIAGFATLGRFYIRWKYTKLDWDDLFNGLALLCIIVFTAIPAMDDLNTSACWLDNFLSLFFLWNTLWMVKASFLALCWMIFNVSATFRKVWWAVAVYTALSYWPVILMHLWGCGAPSDFINPVACISFYQSAPTSYGRFLIISIIEAALHLSSELLILALPLVFIKQLQMSKVQKLSAAAIFGVIIITITIGSLRTMSYIANDLGFNADVSNYIATCTEDVEPALTVLVCALPPYKILLLKAQERKEKAAEKRQDDENAHKMAAPPPPRRNIGIQDSITDLEMA